MAFLDSFPFQDADAQFSGVVRRSARISAGNRVSKKILFDSPEAKKADPGYHSSDPSNTVHENLEAVDHTAVSQAPVEQVEPSGAKNAQGFLKCRLCSYQTKIESLLQWHVKKHSMDASFQCPACDFRQTDVSEFVDHIGTHQSGKLVRCCFCPRKMYRGKLRDHMRVHRAVELYDCSMCQFSTNYVKNIKYHVDVYHTKEQSCQHCSQTMTKHELHWHMKSVHGAVPAVKFSEGISLSPKPAKRGTDTRGPIQPGRALPNQSILPVKLNVPRKPGFSRISKKLSIALKSQKNIVAKKPFNCGKCEYKTPFKKLLRSHRAKHSLDNFLVCSKCGFKETNPGKFAAHLVLHSPKNLIECCFCGFQTQTKKAITKHVFKHKPVSMFDCSECQFSAKRSESVRSHMKRLHGKRLRCKSCNLEMNKFEMASHREECSPSEVPDSGTGPSLATLETVHSKTDVEVASSDTGGKSQPDEKSVTCEFCRRPFAKSYISKHARKCPQNASGPALKKNGDTEATVPNLFPSSSNPANGGARSVLNLQPPIENMQPSADLDPKIFWNRKYRLVLKRLDLNALPLSLEEESINDQPESVDRSEHFKQAKGSNTTKPSTLSCSECVFKTKKRHLLKKHVVKHTVDFRLQCPHCGQKEMGNFTFAKHIHRHKDDKKTFTCCFCDCRPFRHLRFLARHLEKHRPVSIFDCGKCEFSTYRLDVLQQHSERKHRRKYRCGDGGDDVSRFRLSKCMANPPGHGKTSETREPNSSLDADQASVNRCSAERVSETIVYVQPVANGSVLTPNESLAMPVQPEDLEFKQSLINRPTLTPLGDDLAEKDDSGLLSAENRTFLSVLPRNSQKIFSPAPPELRLPEKSPVKLVKPYLRCSKCSFKTRIKFLLRRHVAKHLLDDRFTCTKCDYKESSIWRFSRHWVNHNTTRASMIECCFCTAHFKKKSCLKSTFPYHLEEHRVVNLFDCPKCDFSCSGKSKLLTHHQKVHVKQHYCEACGKFMTLNRLSKHVCKFTGSFLEDPCGSDKGLIRSRSSKRIADKSGLGEDIEVGGNLISLFSNERPNVLASEGVPVVEPGRLEALEENPSSLGADHALNETGVCKSAVPSCVLANHQQLRIVNEPTDFTSTSAMDKRDVHPKTIFLQEQEIGAIDAAHKGDDIMQSHNSALDISGVGFPGEALDLNVTDIGYKNPTESQFIREAKVINISSDSEDSYGSSYVDSEVNHVENCVPQLDFTNIIQDRIKHLIKTPSLDALEEPQNTSMENLFFTEHPVSVSSPSQNGPGGIQRFANEPQCSSGNPSSSNGLPAWWSVNQ